MSSRCWQFSDEARKSSLSCDPPNHNNATCNHSWTLSWSVKLYRQIQVCCPLNVLIYLSFSPGPKNPIFLYLPFFLCSKLQLKTKRTQSGDWCAKAPVSMKDPEWCNDMITEKCAETPRTHGSLTFCVTIASEMYLVLLLCMNVFLAATPVLFVQYQQNDTLFPCMEHDCGSRLMVPQQH